MAYKNLLTLNTDEQKRLQQLVKSMDSISLSYKKTFSNLIEGISGHKRWMESVLSAASFQINPEIMNLYKNYYNNDLATTLKSMTESVNSLSKTLNLTSKSIVEQQLTLDNSLAPIIIRQKELLKGLERINIPQINQLISSFGSMLAQEAANIDLTGLDELDIAINSEEEISLQTTNSDIELSETVAVPRPNKKLVEMTEEDLFNLLKKCVNPKTKVLSVAAFIYSVYSDYVNEIARVVVEILLVFCCSVVSGHFDEHLKTAIKERLMETTTVQDLRKVITKYVKFNPYGQLGFVRKDSYLREGTSKNAPLTTKTKVTTKTPLTVLDRRGNWLKVEVDDGDAKGEKGWIQESTVIKYKKID